MQMGIMDEKEEQDKKKVNLFGEVHLHLSEKSNGENKREQNGKRDVSVSLRN